MIKRSRKVVQKSFAQQERSRKVTATHHGEAVMLVKKTASLGSEAVKIVRDLFYFAYSATMVSYFSCLPLVSFGSSTFLPYS